MPIGVGRLLNFDDRGAGRRRREAVGFSGDFQMFLCRESPGFFHGERKLWQAAPCEAVGERQRADPVAFCEHGMLCMAKEFPWATFPDQSTLIENAKTIGLDDVLRVMIGDYHAGAAGCQLLDETDERPTTYRVQVSARFIQSE